MMKKFMSVFGLFMMCFIVGYAWLQFSTDDYSINRDPAAINSSFDFSHLQGERLQEAVKKRLLTGMEVRKSDTGTGIGLGHFVFVDGAGTKKLACQEFSKISLAFEADGVSVGGDKPTMEVEGLCEFSSDMARINPVFVPIAKILGERPGDGEFQFNEGSVVTVRFANLADSWPRTWLLKSVKLINEKTAESFIVGSDEVSKYLGHPLVMSWQ